MTLLFKPRHIDTIRDGTKTATRREWANNYTRPSEGDIRMAVTEMFTSDEECDCYLRITDVYQEPLGEMGHADARKEGGYDMADFREAWRQINGDWDPELVVDVVEFEYAGRERPAESTASSD
jgi:hypothetical protein